MINEKTSMSRVKNIGRELLLFLTSKIFLKNLAGMIALVAGILALSFFWMSSYTHHGESLQVPSYLNMNIDEATQQAKQQNLKIVVNDSIWSADKPAGTILEQSPKPLSKVKEKRTIYLTITKFQAEEKLLPTLAGNDNYNYYARRLKQLKVNLKVKSKQFSNKLEENTILYLYVNDKKVTARDLKGGIKVPQGAMVEAVVTTRGGGRVSVPNIVCKKYTEAAFIIEGSQLNVSVVPDGTVKSLDNAYVWKQIPEYSSGKTLSVGSTIEVRVTKRPPAECN
ncbi:MAG: PASTA domain-containing protein [Saprospiraceae bacterium]